MNFDKVGKLGFGSSFVIPTAELLIRGDSYSLVALRTATILLPLTQSVSSLRKVVLRTT